MRYSINHLTTYRYSSDVMHSHHLLHLMPRPSAWQQCLESEIEIEPGLHLRSDQFDAFGNPVTRIELSQPHRELFVESRILIDVFPQALVPIEATQPWEQVRDACNYKGIEPDRDVLDACRFRHESQHVRLKSEFREYGENCFGAGRPVLACASALCDQLHADLTYAPGETTISTSGAEVLARKRGVCQDFAHLMIACLRSRGLPARYVSGYVRTFVAGDSQGEALTGAGATHAWVGVWCPPFGWVELDPTNGSFVGTDHIALAWGRDFADVSPLRGVILGGADHELAVRVDVSAVDVT